MRRWKIMIMGLLTAATAMVGPVALVAPDASADTCGGGAPHDPVCSYVIGSTPECKVCSITQPCDVLVVRSQQLAVSTTATLASRNGTAVAGVHYAAIRDGQVIIPAGGTVGSLSLQLFPPEPGAPDRVFYVDLISVSAGTMGNRVVEVHILGGR